MPAAMAVEECSGRSSEACPGGSQFTWLDRRLCGHTRGGEPVGHHHRPGWCRVVTHPTALTVNMQ
jgi:hypothetical protein